MTNDRIKSFSFCGELSLYLLWDSYAIARFSVPNLIEGTSLFYSEGKRVTGINLSVRSPDMDSCSELKCGVFEIGRSVFAVLHFARPLDAGSAYPQYTPTI